MASKEALPLPVTMKHSTAVHECVSDEALSHLKDYKYSSVDKSLISRHILSHYWTAFVELLPLWLAPNMVTLLGFFFILGNVALLVFMVPDLVGPAPGWVYFSFAVGLWMYSTMDNVDGKQARRTGTSSGLGELFDHGIDSLNCTLASLLEAAAIGLGSTYTGAFTALVPCLPMFFSTWETYHTHTLYLGYFNGPTEGLILGTTFMLLAAFYGPEIYAIPLDARFPHLAYVLPANTTFRDLWVPIIIVAFFTGHLPECILNVRRARAEKGLPWTPLIKEWIPIFVWSASCAAWLGSPHSNLLKDNHLVFFCVTMSLVFGRMTTKIILAHLTRQPYPYWTVMLVPLVSGALLINIPFFGCLIGLELQGFSSNYELGYLTAYFLFAAVVYSRWAYLVITSICKYLGIRCLTIPPEKYEAAKLARSLANGSSNGAPKTGGTGKRD